MNKTPSRKEIKRMIRQAIADGHMEEIAPGEFRLTKLGELYTRHLLMTSPSAQDTYLRLMRADKKSGKAQ